MKRIVLGLCALLSSTSGLAYAQDLAPREIDRFIADYPLFPASAAEATADCDRYLARLAQERAALEAETGPATIDGTFQRYDDLTLIVLSALTQTDTLIGVAPQAEVRTPAQECAQRVGDAMTELSLSRPIFDRLSAIDQTAASPEQRHLIQRALRDSARVGVDRDQATRDRLGALQRRETAASIAFSRNIADGRLTMTARPEELAGLPADWIAAHPAGADGLVTISTDYPDLQPVMSYATNADLRRRLYVLNLQRAWPANDVALGELLAARYEIARTLDRPNYASIDLDSRMLNTPAKVQAFLDGLDATTAAPALRDRNVLIARLAQDDPSITALPAWSSGHASGLVRKEQYAVDPQEVRQYFSYNNVRDGIFMLTESLFGVDIRPWDTPVWADGVEAYEMYENGVLIGRFYMDNHPRPGKFNHARVSIIRTGIAGRAIPVGTLVCNFPAGDHATGLMEHGQVETFLHEFGHLLHLIYAGRQTYALQNPFIGLEADFTEAPSTMLENWVWDYDTLKTFAFNAQGDVIPRDLVERMNRARGFGEAFAARRQMGLSAGSLALYSGPPPSDLTEAYHSAEARYWTSNIGDEVVHTQASFGHLSGYASAYYTYLWSEAISTDLFTRFEANGLRDPETARRYRDLVLAPGSSVPATRLVEDFLERPMSLAAFEARLNR